MKKTTANTGNVKTRVTRSTSFGIEELLLLANAFMAVSCNVKQGTDKTADNFRMEIQEIQRACHNDKQV